MKLYLVGGAVREHLFGRTAKDLDFAVEAESYEEMRAALVWMEARIWEERPEFVTIRCAVERSWLGDFGGLLQVASDKRVNADFTLCRAEAQYSDKRHPDSVTPASLLVDLTRRDFTMNAIAVSEEGAWIDPFGGREDVARRVLRAVGTASVRFHEDPLRILRAIRFSVTNELFIDPSVEAAINLYAFLLADLPVERVREEFHRAMRADWYSTMRYIFTRTPVVASVLASYDKLWMKPTTEDR